MQKITEEDKDIIEGWFKSAREQTLETLPDFLKGLTRYEHDYGTICHAMTAAAVGAAASLDKTDQGGITGFQASAIFWEFYRRWMRENGPARILKYEEMLYPQYERKYDKTISPGTWKWLQDEAAKNLQSRDGHPVVVAHWESIVKGQVPFGYRVSDD